MFKETYINVYKQIIPSKQLISAVLASERTTRKHLRRSYLAFRKPVLISIVIALCFLFPIPVLAVNIPATYELLYSVSPSVAQFYKPVKKSSDNNGIRMEVISTYIHDSTAELYVSMQDLTGDRIDATTDLFDSYSIRRPFPSSATCQRVGFDAESNTVTFLINITEWGRIKISGEKITFSVSRFLSGKSIYDDVPINIETFNIMNDPITMPIPERYGYGGDYDFQKFGIPDVLVPTTSTDFGVNEIAISAIGYIDGMLHVQTATNNNLTNDNHGYFYFVDKENRKRIQSLYSISFADVQNHERFSYNECVFDIPRSRLNEYDMYGYFVSGGTFTDGPWEVTFPLEIGE